MVKKKKKKKKKKSDGAQFNILTEFSLRADNNLLSGHCVKLWWFRLRKKCYTKACAWHKNER